jgi:hypothetical protein
MLEKIVPTVKTNQNKKMKGKHYDNKTIHIVPDD